MTGRLDQPRSTRVSLRTPAPAARTSGKRRKKGAEAHLALRAGQRGPQAEVPAARKGQVAAGIRAFDVEPVRIGEYGRVGVGGGHVDQHRVALLDPPAGNLGVGHRRPRAEQHRGLHSQDLLDRGGPVVRVLAQHLELVGGVHQQPDSVAKQVDGGFETGGEHQSGGGAQLGVGEINAVLRGSDERAHQVVARCAPQPSQVFGEPVVEAAQPVPHVAVLRPGEPEVQARGGQLAVFQDAGPVTVGHAEYLADHRDGQLRAVAFDHVDDARVPGKFVE